MSLPTHVTWIPVSSTAVKEVAYDGLREEIYVRFSRGVVYRYTECSDQDFRELVDASSIGQHVNDVLKYKPYAEVSDV